MVRFYKEFLIGINLKMGVSKKTKAEHSNLYQLRRFIYVTGGSEEAIYRKIWTIFT